MPTDGLDNLVRRVDRLIEENDRFLCELANDERARELERVELEHAA